MLKLRNDQFSNHEFCPTFPNNPFSSLIWVIFQKNGSLTLFTLGFYTLFSLRGADSAHRTIFKGNTVDGPK